MALRISSYVHLLPIGVDRVLVVHAMTGLQLSVSSEVSNILCYFSQPRDMPANCDDLERSISRKSASLNRCIAALIKRNLLTEKSAEEERALYVEKLSSTFGRDPLVLLEHYRRGLKEGAQPYWSVTHSCGIDQLGASGKHVEAILFGDCDMQMESDFLRREALRRGFDLCVAATFPNDLAFATEHKHDVIFVGAHRARHSIMYSTGTDGKHHSTYIREVGCMLKELRQTTSAPIIIDNLPEPTVQPLGIAERGLDGHRTRFRSANVALAELTSRIPDVYILDVTAAFGAGSCPAFS